MACDTKRMGAGSGAGAGAGAGGEGVMRRWRKGGQVEDRDVKFEDERTREGYLSGAHREKRSANSVGLESSVLNPLACALFALGGENC
eukprot:764472-Hanusia_phi.AAC.5